MLNKGLALIFVSLCVTAQAQVEVQDEVDPRSSEAPAPHTAPAKTKNRADSYFQVRKVHKDPEREVASSGGASFGREHYMGLHIGTFVSQEQYKWGTNNSNNIGHLNFGVDYKIGEWTKSMDLLLRADLTTYALNEGDSLKLSFVPMIIFPDAASQFPLYFGAGAGLGIFMKQIHGQSALSFDYQIVAGVRVFDIWDGIGLTLETGLKNHIHLLSQGQYNSVFVTVGTVFTF